MATTRKTPQDHKKPAVAEFVYECEFGTVTLPGFMPTGALRKFRKLSELDMILSIIEEYADEESLEVVDQLPQDDIDGIDGSFKELTKSWMESLGMTPGNS